MTYPQVICGPVYGTVSDVYLWGYSGKTAAEEGDMIDEIDFEVEAGQPTESKAERSGRDGTGEAMTDEDEEAIMRRGPPSP